MNLLDMKPKESKLKLKSLKNDLTLRPVSLADEAWLDEQYGSKEITKIFNEVNIKEISKIVFRLLDNESKKIFKKQIVEMIDENGDSSEVELGGVELFRSMIIGWDEKVALLNALLENIGLSRPAEKEIDVKKKAVKETMEMPL